MAFDSLAHTFLKSSHLPAFSVAWEFKPSFEFLFAESYATPLFATNSLNANTMTTILCFTKFVMTFIEAVSCEIMQT